MQLIPDQFKMLPSISQRLLSLGSKDLSFNISSITSLLLSQEWRMGGGLQVRFRFRDIEVPKPGKKCYRRIVHYPEKYTIKPIPTTNLGGRDPVTGKLFLQISSLLSLFQNIIVFYIF